jgi:hypothetical protein
MKRFLVFGGMWFQHNEYCGGWKDLVEQCDTMAQVQDCLNDWWDRENKWYHVVDSSTGKIFMSG